MTAQNAFELRISEPLIRRLLDSPRLKEKHLEIEHFEITDELLIFRGAVEIDLKIKMLRVGFELHIRPLEVRDRRICVKIEKLAVAGSLPLPTDAICKRFLHKPPRLVYDNHKVEADLEAVLNRLRKHSFANEGALITEMIAPLRSWPAMAGVDLSPDSSPDALLGRAIDALLTRPEIKLTAVSLKNHQVILTF